MMIAVFLAFNLDAKFCPLAPSPEVFSQTVSNSLDSGGKWVPNSAQTASRLVDTRKANAPTIGWLYMDEHGEQYVSLVPPVTREFIKTFPNMERWANATTYTQAVSVRPDFVLPKGIEIRSCTESANG